MLPTAQHQARTDSPTVSRINRTLALGLWLAIFLLIAASGSMASLQPPWPQLILAVLVLLLLAAYAISKGMRDWLHMIPLESLIALHLVRFVGVYFLWLHVRRELPHDFAVPAGCGDIAVASFAVLLLISRPANRRAYLAWNFLGLLDILFVVITAARLAMANPASMAALVKLPLSLLPTFIVPVVIFTHIVIFIRQLGPQPQAKGKENARPGRQPERAHLPP